jgi:nitrile hydratase
MSAVDGIHDLGGKDGFGPVVVEAGEPVFHARWEARVLGTTFGAMATGAFNTPMFRHAIERMDPAHYLTSSYYEHWLTAVATLLAEAGVIAPEDLEAKAGRFPLARPVAPRAGEVGAEPPTGDRPRFAVGDPVHVVEQHPFGHTRCPGYVRGRVGTVTAVEPPAPVPEIEAHRREIVPETVYNVRFDGAELWGDAAEPSTSLHIDLYERYLEPLR